jgi:hypothetical protein
VYNINTQISFEGNGGRYGKLDLAPAATLQMIITIEAITITDDV